MLRGATCAHRQAEADGALDRARFITGSVPGRARSTAQAWVLGSAPKATGRRLKILLFGGQLGVGLEADHDLVTLHQQGCVFAQLVWGPFRTRPGRAVWKSVACCSGAHACSSAPPGNSCR
jgi:hypothetical protein